MGTKELFNLEGEKAIVTAGSQGLGEQMAMALAEAGADVATVDIDLEKAKRLLKMQMKNMGSGLDS